MCATKESKIQRNVRGRSFYFDRAHFATSSSPLIKLRHKITKQRAVSARVAANNADLRATRLLHFAINDAAAR